MVIVGSNKSARPGPNAHLLKYDTSYGKLRACRCQRRRSFHWWAPIQIFGKKDPDAIRGRTSMSTLWESPTPSPTSPLCSARACR